MRITRRTIFFMPAPYIVARSAPITGAERPNYIVERSASTGSSAAARTEG